MINIIATMRLEKAQKQNWGIEIALSPLTCPHLACRLVTSHFQLKVRIDMASFFHGQFLCACVYECEFVCLCVCKKTEVKYISLRIKLLKFVKRVEFITRTRKVKRGH